MKKSTKIEMVKLSTITTNPDNPNPSDLSVSKINTAVKANGFSEIKGALTVEIMPDGTVLTLCGNNRLTWAKKVYDLSPALYKQVIGHKDSYPCYVLTDLTEQERQGYVFDVSANKVINDYYYLAEIYKATLIDESVIVRAIHARHGFENRLQAGNAIKFSKLVDDYCNGIDNPTLSKDLHSLTRSHVQYSQAMFCGSPRMKASLWDTYYPSDNATTSEHMLDLKKDPARALKNAYVADGNMEGETFCKLWDDMNVPKIKAFSEKLVAVKDFKEVLNLVTDPALLSVLEALVVTEEIGTSPKAKANFIQALNDFQMGINKSVNLDVECDDLEGLSLDNI